MNAATSISIAAALAAGSAFAADIEAGKSRAGAVCAACHGANGVSVANHIPSLAGQRAVYLDAQLKAFRDKSRKHDVMNPIAGQLGAAEIANLAAWFASLPGAQGEARSAFMPALATTRMTIPMDFPAGFTRYQVKIADDRASMTMRYANEVALRAAREGKPLPDGAVIIAENHAVKQDKDKQPILGVDGNPVSDKVLSYVGMARAGGWGNDIPDLLRNENWNYGLFDAARQPRANVQYGECFACHKPRDKESFLFTLPLIAAAK